MIRLSLSDIKAASKPECLDACIAEASLRDGDWLLFTHEAYERAQQMFKQRHTAKPAHDPVTSLLVDQSLGVPRCRECG
jgi:hypothetical protein